MNKQESEKFLMEYIFNFPYNKKESDLLTEFNSIEGSALEFFQIATSEYIKPVSKGDWANHIKEIFDKKDLDSLCDLVPIIAYFKYRHAGLERKCAKRYVHYRFDLKKPAMDALELHSKLFFKEKYHFGEIDHSNQNNLIFDDEMKERIEKLYQMEKDYNKKHSENRHYNKNNYQFDKKISDFNNETKSYIKTLKIEEN